MYGIPSLSKRPTSLEVTANFLLGLWIGGDIGILRPIQNTPSLTYIADNSAALQKNIFRINSSLNIMLRLHLRQRDIRYLNNDHG
jgi:hypothetical protein